ELRLGHAGEVFGRGAEAADAGVRVVPARQQLRGGGPATVLQLLQQFGVLGRLPGWVGGDAGQQVAGGQGGRGGQPLPQPDRLVHGDPVVLGCGGQAAGDEGADAVGGASPAEPWASSAVTGCSPRTRAQASTAARSTPTAVSRSARPTTRHSRAAVSSVTRSRAASASPARTRESSSSSGSSEAGTPGAGQVSRLASRRSGQSGHSAADHGSSTASSTSSGPPSRRSS